MKKLIYFLFGVLTLCLWLIAYYPTINAELSPKVFPPKVSTFNSTIIEEGAFYLINVVREQQGLSPTKWDDELYKLSLAHTKTMAQNKRLFHSPETVPYAENCWGGPGLYPYPYTEIDIAGEMVNGWLASPLHRAWLLHEPIKTSVLSVVITPSGQYASWTFWQDEVGLGPPLIQEIYNEWQIETSGNIPWLAFLRSKGYID